MSKVLKLSHFLLESGCEDYSFLNQGVEDFEHSLDSILTESVETPELDASFDEPDAVATSVLSGFLSLVSTLSDNSKAQLAPSIKSQIKVPSQGTGFAWTTVK